MVIDPNDLKSLTLNQAIDRIEEEKRKAVDKKAAELEAAIDEAKRKITEAQRPEIVVQVNNFSFSHSPNMMTFNTLDGRQKSVAAGPSAIDIDIKGVIYPGDNQTIDAALFHEGFEVVLRPKSVPRPEWKPSAVTEALKMKPVSKDTPITEGGSW